MGLLAANGQGRAAALRELAQTLAANIDLCEDQKLLPQLARQYRETLRELDEIGVSVDDKVEALLDGLTNVR